ncbi:transketolase [Microbaculum marinisediminis]|uniref:Transketolase n=1 Tax=Microbaculum marinisediminis TaxID=2931392 RepID=A0AAW5R260_9HYPH|nr:transketolase [Microbaculum sp. A6E488]MCT8973447.1 transketolase [Microbaculum sp. A6E488]
MANAIRALSMDAVEKAKSGHPGMPMGMADVATVLFTRFLKFDPADPSWPDRDRFVLSAGHGSMLLYSLLYLTGYDGVTLDELKTFRQLGSKTAGHPEYGHCPGVETTTGPLGQGIANAVGMALAERMLNARFGDALVNHFTYVVAGDGCLMEGLSHEAIDLAGHLRLNRLIVLFDDNGISIDGDTSLATSTDQLARFAAAGWDVTRVDGHDPEAVAAAIQAAKLTGTPSLIACRTVIGYGAPTKQGTEATHGAPLGADEVAGARAALGWSHAPFEIPTEILAAWRSAGSRGADAHLSWERRLQSADPDTRQAFLDGQRGTPGLGLDTALANLKASFAAEAPKIATRQASQKVIDQIAPVLPALIGGSADLTGSNLTKARSQETVTADKFAGGYIHYGVREHVMGAAMNGIALHGGFIPYGGTFLVFTDYCRPSIRLSALMGQRVIYVMTHDSIGLGEDGPTHQPVEHLAGLRAMPNVNVFRPADAMETVEAWACALADTDTPSVLCLSRQGLPALRREAGDDNPVARGAYVVSGDVERRDVTLLATGSEVALAVEAAAKLGDEGIAATVVSMPCWELFRVQPEAYRTQVLGTAPRIAVEAAIETGWERWIGETGRFVGMTGFGASAPAGDLYAHFGITVAAIVAAAKEIRTSKGE